MIYYSKSIPLLSNSFRIKNANHKLFVRFRVVIETKRLSVYNLSLKRSNRLKLIKSLSDGGVSNVDISNYLNSRGILSVRGRSYTPKLIWGLLKKYNLRLQRNKSDRIIYKSEVICIIP